MMVVSVFFVQFPLENSLWRIGLPGLVAKSHTHTGGQVLRMFQRHLMMTGGLGVQEKHQ